MPNAARDRGKPMYTKNLLFGLVAMVLTIVAGAVVAAPLTVEVGKARILRLSADPDIVMLGNPAVADVVVEDDRLLFLLGREPGETNLYVLNDEGKVILSRVVVVGPVLKRRVTVDRGPQTFTLSCNPRCVPVATPQGAGATTAAAGGGDSGGAAGAEGDPLAALMQQAGGEGEGEGEGEGGAGGDAASLLGGVLGGLLGAGQ
ncbi:MAG: pilus assembly protein N-terminal domain-containing protein [Alphaproteobacteria bacterium]|nr:pilus assembly protein N-terminal domain-containing protein [Alphaproteobacteria bacterium]MDP6564132.1 pilus assembly protein N-terminal domain-containing protein [Alphaproteobacteria bacterium]MDP6815551.1 pilus assembly protein N-terminal domain-containing protein [Alphaproteobacteria bacterium]